MRICQIILTFIICFSLYASDPSPRQKVLGALPEELRQLSAKDSQKSLEQKFAKKIQSKDKNALYLNYFGQSNDVTIGLKDGRFEYVYVKLPKSVQLDGKKLFEQSLNSLSPEEKKIQLEKWDKEDLSHEAGRYLSIHMPKENLKLEFKRNETRDVNSLVMWPEAGGNK